MNSFNDGTNSNNAFAFEEWNDLIQLLQIYSNASELATADLIEK